MTPTQIGRYEIRSEIGRGGMATVYRAYDPRFKRDVALKILPSELLHDPSFRSRFQREAEIIASLEHQAIVPVYDYGEEGDQPYIVMRLMPGGSLADRVERGALSLDEAARVVANVAPALDRAHEKGIVHRDLKPGNILFDADNNPYISDFGIAKLSQATAKYTGTAAIVGTPDYMSPEQARGDRSVDGRTDIYALGVIVFQILTGKLPYESDTPMGLVVKHLTEPVPDILAAKATLPAACSTLIFKAMAKRPADRYPTAAELSRALTKIASREKTKPMPLPVVPRWVLFSSTAAVLTVGLGLVLAAAIAGIGGLIYFGTRATSTLTVSLGQTEPVSVAVEPTAAQLSVTETVQATSTAVPTIIPTLAPGEIGKLFDGSSLLQLLLDDQKLISAPANSPWFIAVNHRSQGENADLYVQGGSQLQFNSVTDVRVQLRLQPGSDLFVQTGSYNNGAVIELAGMPITVTVQGCLAAYYPDTGTFVADCYSGTCAYSTSFGSEYIQFGKGQQVTIDLKQLITSTSNSIPPAEDAKYSKLMTTVSAGRNDLGRCGVTDAAATQAVQATARAASRTPLPGAVATAVCKHLQSLGTPCP